MNLRQAQQSLSELILKCEASHVQLPKDPLEARAEAVESIIRSLKNGRPDLKLAQDEIQQKFGIQRDGQQQMENDEFKRLRRRQSRQKRMPSNQTKTVKSAQVAAGESTQCQLVSKLRHSRTAFLTESALAPLSMQSQLTSQEEEVAIQVESSREQENGSDTEEKELPGHLSRRTIKDNHSNNVLPDSPDQEMIHLLEELDEDDGGEGNSASSDEDKEFGSLRQKKFA